MIFGQFFFLRGFVRVGNDHKLFESAHIPSKSAHKRLKSAHIQPG